MNRSVMAALVATAVAGGGTFVATRDSAPPPPSTIVQVTQAAKRTWPAMTAAQQQQLVHALGASFKDVRVHIVCGGTFCADIADDLNEAFEDVGANSTVEVPMFDLGRGMGISPEDDRTRMLAAAIDHASSGQVKPQLFDVDTKGEIVIGIARPPRLAPIVTGPLPETGSFNCAVDPRACAPGQRP